MITLSMELGHERCVSLFCKGYQYSKQGRCVDMAGASHLSS